MSADLAGPSLDEEDLETWASLATVLEWLPPALDAPLQRGFGLTHFEYGVLFALAAAPDRTLRMSLLAGYANSSLSRLSRAVARLEARSWIRRRVNPADGRSALATLTNEGQQQYEAATPAHVENVHRLVLNALTRAQKQQLRVITRRIAQSINENGSWPSTSSTLGR